MSVEKISGMNFPIGKLSLENKEFSLNRDFTVCTKAETVLLGES